MAQFKKKEIAEALRLRLVDATTDGDARHEKSVTEWESEKRAIQNGKKRIRQYVRDLTDDKITVEQFAKQLSEGFSGWSNQRWAEPAKEQVKAPPTRKETIAESQINRVLRVLESSPDETVSTADLRALGIVDFLKLTIKR